MLALALLALLPWTSAGTEQVVLDSELHSRPYNVAIIGAGAAGSSAAYHIARHAASGDISFDITVFERNDYVGGRSTTVSVYDDSRYPVELGASIFVKVNKILVDAAKEFNLSTSKLSSSAAPSSSAPAVGVWDGREFRLTMQDTNWLDLAKLFWRYGTAPVRTVRLMKATVGRFLQMYESPVFPFASLTQAAEDVDLLKVTGQTGEQYMAENGIIGKFGAEIVQSSTRVNYATNLKHIHGLEAMVCMATDGAMAVKGGNWRIFEGMLRASRAKLMLGTEVQDITRQVDGKYSLKHTHRPRGFEDADESATSTFDAVIIAAPFQYTGIKITNEELTAPEEIPYVELHVTLFASPLLPLPAFFNIDTPVPHTILTTLPDNEPAQSGNLSVGSPGFFSISRLQTITSPVSGEEEYVYKIFSAAPLSRSFIDALFGIPSTSDLSSGLLSLDTDMQSGDGITPSKITWLYGKIWHSYPYEFPRVTFEEIKLADGLWYTGGMDSFISTMETNALMGKNVAALVYEEAELRRLGGNLTT